MQNFIHPHIHSPVPSQTPKPIRRPTHPPLGAPLKLSIPTFLQMSPLLCLQGARKRTGTGGAHSTALARRALPSHGSRAEESHYLLPADAHRLLKHGPDDGLAAVRGGQGALVAVVPGQLCNVRQQRAKAEGGGQVHCLPCTAGRGHSAPLPLARPRVSPLPAVPHCRAPGHLTSMGDVPQSPNDGVVVGVWGF